VRFFPWSRDNLGTSPDNVRRKKARPGRFWSSTPATCTGKGNLFFNVRVCRVPCTKVQGTESAFAKTPWTCETTKPFSHDQRLTRASRAYSEGALTKGNAAQTQCHLHLRHCLATPKQLLCLFPTPFLPTPQGGHHGSPVQSPLRSFRHADHASGRRTSGTTSRGFEPPPTLSSRAPKSFAPEEGPASPSSAWRSAPAPAAPPCPHRAAVGVVAAGARRRRRAASAAPARTCATPWCGRRLRVRPTGGPRPIGRRGGRCMPVAAAR